MENRLRRLLWFLLVSALLSLSIPQGFGRNVDLFLRHRHRIHTNNPSYREENNSMKEMNRREREMREIVTNDDYDGPTANPRNGPHLNPAPPTTPPPPPTPTH